MNVNKKDKDKKKGLKEKKSNSLSAQLKKFIKTMRVKEIRPLHVDLMKETELKEHFKKFGRRLNLRFYDNNPLRRLTSLFTRGTQIKLKEIEGSEIDF
jgi:hypothetical protein